MSEPRYQVDPTYTAWDNNEGVGIEVSTDELDLINITPAGKKGKEYYGEYNVLITKGMALALAKAIIKTVEESGGGN